jgi:hypothetical protein
MMTSKEYPYAMQLTMRRSRDEIVAGKNSIRDPTKKGQNREIKRVMGKIIRLTEELQKMNCSGKEAKEVAECLYWSANRLRNKSERERPAWREFDKTLSF